MSLHPQQLEAIEFLDAWMGLPVSEGSKYNRMFVLKGYAGTGKTFLLGYWIDRLLKQNPRLNVVIAAPTNKALDVLRQKCQSILATATFFTCDSFLGNKVGRTEEGDKHVIYGKARLFPDLLVVDEASMVKSDMFSQMSGKAKKILYVGDPAQLPPINEVMSEAFKIENKYQMTEVVRFDGSIIKIATQLRQWIGLQENFILQDIRKLVDDNNTSFISKNSLYDWALTAYRKGMDSKIVAWRNADVDMHNFIMHQALFPDAELFGIGERVIANDTHDFKDPETDEDKVIYNGELLTVYECVPAEYVASIPTFDVTVVRQYGEKVSMRVALSETAATARLKELNEEIYYGRRDGKDVRPLLKDRKALLALAPIRHSYSCTVHKSQGSTYDICFTDWSSIYRCSDRARMLYVAVTRPSKFLVLVS